MPTFSKKHYETIAKALAKAAPKVVNMEAPNAVLIHTAQDVQFEHTVTQVCDLFKEDNPRFDGDKFMEAVQELGRCQTR